jgi:hypothetical protein
MTTTADLLKLTNQIADLTSAERVRLGRILVDEYGFDACDMLDGIQDGFAILEKELELVK